MTNTLSEEQIAAGWIAHVPGERNPIDPKTICQTMWQGDTSKVQAAFRQYWTRKCDAYRIFEPVRPSPRIAELEAALKPFADFASKFTEKRDETYLDGEGRITVGDLRRAASALKGE